jgi:hypothetical protein
LNPPSENKGKRVDFEIRNEDYIQNESELKVRNCLKQLQRPDYYSTHDLTIPKMDGTSQIDHVIVSRKGIFVIETKSHNGAIYGQEDDYQWTCIQREKHYFYNPLKQNNGHIKAIRALIGAEDLQCINIVVFTENPSFKTNMPENVLRLDGLISYIESFATDRLDQEQVIKFVGVLEFFRKERSKETNEQHIKYVKENFVKNKPKSDSKAIHIKPSDDRTPVLQLSKEYKNRINKRDLKLMKYVFMSIPLIFLIKAYPNKNLELKFHSSEIKTTQTVRPKIKEDQENKLNRQDGQLTSLPTVSTKQSFTTDREGYLNNAIGLPSVDQYNKLAKSKGDDCQIAKVNNVWQRVCK